MSHENLFAAFTTTFFSFSAQDITLLAADSLKEQFNSRFISMLVSLAEAERSANQNEWFDDPVPEEIDPEAAHEAVRVDLLSFSEKFLPNFKYKEEIDKGFVNTTEMKRSKRYFYIPSRQSR